MRDPTVDRFPTGQAAARRRAEQRAQQQERQRRELVDDRDQTISSACDAVSPEQRLTCPLRPDTVEVVENVPRGVRLRMRGQVSAGTLNQLMDCQVNLARVHPERPPLCAFSVPGLEHRVVEHQGRVHVELRVPTPDLDAADSLRARVRAAFPRGK